MYKVLKHERLISMIEVVVGSCWTSFNEPKVKQPFFTFLGVGRNESTLLQQYWAVEVTICFNRKAWQKSGIELGPDLSANGNLNNAR